jgi:hypothetical protein
MDTTEEVIEALARIEEEGLTPEQAFVAKILVALVHFERGRLANGEKPLRELNVTDVIEIVQGAAPPIFPQPGLEQKFQTVVTDGPRSRKRRNTPRGS